MKKSKKKSGIPLIKPINRSVIPCRKLHKVTKKVIDRKKKHKDNHYTDYE